MYVSNIIQAFENFFFVHLTVIIVLHCIMVPPTVKTAEIAQI